MKDFPYSYISVVNIAKMGMLQKDIYKFNGCPTIPITFFTEIVKIQSS